MHFRVSHASTLALRICPVNFAFLGSDQGLRLVDVNERNRFQTSYQTFQTVLTFLPYLFENVCEFLGTAKDVKSK